MGASTISVNDQNLENLAAHYAKGLRLLQLSHNERNGVGDGFRERIDAGLSLLGEAVVREMNRLGMVIDVSHCSDLTTLQTIERSAKPIAVTHAGCRALFDSRRNKTDAAIRALANKGGYFGVYMMSRWLTAAPTSSVENVVDHIDHVVQVGGIATAGFGSDQPWSGDPTPQVNKMAGLANYQARNAGLPGAEPLMGHVTCADMDSLQRMNILERALRRRGYRSAAIDAILGGNFVRVFQANCG